MTNPNRFFLVVLVLFLAYPALSQQAIPGRVIDVIDGKTFVIELRTGKVTGVLQHIDVPEPEQQLHQVATDHLKQLVLGKVGTFRPLGISKANSVGRLIIGGVDISEQMLRDGAAWLAPWQMAGSEAPERDSYGASEARAKAENLGVWSVKGLKPAWQYRFDKDERQRQDEERYWQQYSNAAKPGPPSTRDTRSSTKPGINNTGGFISKYDAATRSGRIETPVLPVRDMQGLGRKAACSLAYFYHDEGQKNRKGTFMFYIAFVDTPRPGSNSDLVIMADGQKIAVDKAKRSTQTAGISVVESLVFEMSRSTVERIANGNDVGLRLGNEVFIPAPGFQMLIYNLLDATK